MLEDTIAAIATPLGEGGLAVIRVSGGDALTVVDRCFRPARNYSRTSEASSHSLQYGHLYSGEKRIDEVLVAVMRSPRTFTREDVVEITCHGGILAVKLALDAILATGARVADPGEFTRRAFLNGRIDLAQAEAVADVIHARTELALAAANEQLAGKLSQRINLLRDDLMRCLAHIEAHLDFPDEDIAPDTREQLLGRIHSALSFVEELLSTADEGRLLRRGIRAAIVGRPNTGKSSLLNQLLGHERAIVSPIPGTTRDTIEETANIRGFPVVFIDTAGVRHSEDHVEREGVRRTQNTLAAAELVLHVLDGSEEMGPQDLELLELSAGKKRILVCNKVDLGVRLTLPVSTDAASVRVSCLTGQGIEQLKDEIKKAVWSGRISAEMVQVTINSRHQEALSRARAALTRAREALSGEATLELVASDLRLCVNAVGEIVGKTTTEDLLDHIFSQFCIGK